MKALGNRLHPDHGTVVVNLHSDDDQQEGGVMGKHVSDVCRSYKDAVLGNEGRGIVYTVSVPWVCNSCLIVGRGFGGSGEMCGGLDLSLNSVMSHSIVVEQLLGLPFSCMEYIKRGFRQVKTGGVASMDMNYDCVEEETEPKVDDDHDKYLLHCLEVLHNYSSMRNPRWNSSRTRISPVDSSACVALNEGSKNSSSSSQLRCSSSSSYMLLSSGVSRHRRAGSVSSVKSSFSDAPRLPRSTASSSSLRGRMRCIRKDDGLPHHVFDVEEDEREMRYYYGARASKVESFDDEYVYTFYSAKRGGNKRDYCDASKTIATMRVSTSDIASCSGTKKAVETKFTLYSFCENHGDDDELNNADPVRSSKPRRSRSRSRSLSRTWESPAEIRYCSGHEVAAIVLKQVRRDEHVGGWGFKFLERGESSSSTTMNVLIPAGVHGGTTMRRSGVRGPSSLIERWNSGGVCDCGGWDVGCPLTVLETPSAECLPIDLFTQGSRGDSPAFSMANVCDAATYSIHFRPTLSYLQCFAIAAAVFHCNQKPRTT
ncbi:hypothetical protein M569_15973 [Genlisea aurea]|uniref:Uncharacterized protein n=1 Tax=Genlisea aurea TaxID=192259 RepID=S8BWZ9_9LAMI|nr:hypothetical protein M569_15973 [Genlisea aurea]